VKLEPYLCFGGYEIANAMRTETYLRRGLAGSEWGSCTVGDPVSQAVPYDVTVGDVYDDTYTDVYPGSVLTLYRQDSMTPQNLCGYCAAMDFSADQPTFNYLSPKDDDAPWYTAARPASADFLGLLLSEAVLQPVLSRSLNSSGPVGATLGRLFPRHRILSVSAIMFAASECGMEYGERWLTDVLSGFQCDPLTDLGDCVVLPCCDEDAFRTLKRAGIVDGPTFSELGSDGSIPTCHAQRVEFQLCAELPWLMADATTLVDEDVVSTLHAASGLAQTDDWVGDAGVRVTIDPQDEGFSGTISATPLPPGYDCPTEGLSPALLYTVTGLPAGHVLTFDSAARSVLEWDTAGKRYDSGFSRLAAEDGWAWLEVPPCSRVCVKVAATSGRAVVTVEQINREL
jgi:hypothetical protein